MIHFFDPIQSRPVALAQDQVPQERLTLLLLIQGFLRLCHFFLCFEHLLFYPLDRLKLIGVVSGKQQSHVSFICARDGAERGLLFIVILSLLVLVIDDGCTVLYQATDGPIQVSKH